MKYIVVELTEDEWQRFYRGGVVGITEIKSKALLSADELRFLALKEEAKKVS